MMIPPNSAPVEDEAEGSDPTGSQAAPPLVSVVIPAYQAAHHIAQALESVFAQTYLHFEVIVVNDGSPDGDLLEQALQPYKARIRYLKQENRGPSGARNAGILHARGKYIAFLDSDDVWFPDHLTNQLSLLLGAPSLGLVYADYILVKDDVSVGHGFGQQPQLPAVSFESLVVEDCAIGTSSAVALRQALIDAGLFDERFRRCEDFDLWLRMAFRGTPMDYCRAKGLYHRVSENGLSADRVRMWQALIEVLEKTASTLPLSVSQRQLVCQRIKKMETACQVELVKQFLDTGEYERALDAARNAHAAARNWKLGLTVLGLRGAPKLLRYCHRGYQQVLQLRNRVRVFKSAPRLKAQVRRAGPEVRSSARPESAG